VRELVTTRAHYGASINPEVGDDDRFHSIFTAIDEGYCLCEMILDDSGEPIDYRFLETNPMFEEMTGLVDAVGKTAYELVPNLEHHWVETYARAAIGGERIRFQQGSEAMGRWFDVFTMPIEPRGRFAIVFKDDSARHRAKSALQKSEQSLRDLAIRERRNSLRLQHALLPAELVARPNLSITAEYQSIDVGTTVGGDWYDTFSWSDGRVGIMVGDVVGHNLDAAATMGHLRAGVAALARHLPAHPTDLLEALDECARAPGGADFVTACCVVIDPSDGHCVYSSAGHPPPLLIAPDGDVCWLDDALTTPIGMLDLAATASSVILPADATVILYSDGLIEGRPQSADGGRARLERTAVGLLSAHPDDFSKRLMAEMARISPPTDDAVVVSVRYTPSAR